jgi:hypothetical protein
MASKRGHPFFLHSISRFKLNAAFAFPSNRVTERTLMKTKLTLIIAVGLGLVTSGAFAYDRDEHRDDNRNESYSGDRNGDNDRHDDNDRHGDWGRHRGELQAHINRMNKMLAHVKWELSQYKGDWRLKREAERISDEARRINWKFEHRRGDRDEIRSDVQRIRAKLHNIEERLHVRSGDFFRWD